MTHPNTRRDFLGLALKSALALPLATAPVSGGQMFHDKRRPADERTDAPGTAVRLSVTDFGAVGDGKQKNTAQIQEAIDRCSVLGGGKVIIPQGDFLTGAIALRSMTTIVLEEGAVLVGSPDMEDYPVTQVRWEGKWIQGHSALLYAINAHDIAVTGHGTIRGNAGLGGRPTRAEPLRHPALIEPIGCHGVRLDGFSAEYHLMWCVHPTYSDDIHITGLRIRSTGGNGDGIDIDSCAHVVIDGCDIATGDDCIAIKSGRGMEGYLLARPTEDVVITNCRFADAIFACIGIGSETSGGIRGVRIEHCTFTHARTFALYIKSRVGRGAYIEDITARDLDVSGMEGGFLRLNLTGSGIRDPDPVPGAGGIPAVKRLRFTDIRVKDVPVLVDARAVHPDKPLEGFTLSAVSGTCKQGLLLANIRDAEIGKLHLSGYAGPLIRATQVTGRGLSGASHELELPEIPEVIAAPAVPYRLH